MHNNFWTYFDKNLLEPILATHLRVVSAFDGSLLGAELRREKDLNHPTKNPSIKFTNFDINNRLHNCDRRGIKTGSDVRNHALLYLNESKCIKYYFKKISPLILSFFACMNLILFIIDIELLQEFKPIIDCIVPGRLVWTGSIASRSRMYSLLVLLLLAILKLLHSKNERVLYLDLIEFFLSTKLESELQFNYSKYKSQLGNIDCFHKAANALNSSKNAKFDSIFHARYDSSRIIPKMNRDPNCKRILTWALRCITVEFLLLAIIIIVVVLIYVFRFSLTLEGESIAYPSCTFWRIPERFLNNSTPSIMGYGIIFRPLKLNDPVIIYHALSNTFFCAWFMLESVMFATSLICILQIIPIDSLLFCRNLKNLMQQLIVRLENPEHYDYYETKFLCISIHLQALTYFNLIKCYNILIKRISVELITINLVVNLLTYGATVINGKILEDRETYFVTAQISLADLLMFIFLGLVRKYSLDIYQLISTICAKCSDPQIKVRYSSLLSFYTWPGFCFRIGKVEISLFYLLKSTSYLATILAFVYSVHITRGYANNLIKLSISKDT